MMSNIIPRKCLADEVAVVLRKQITEGKYRNGDRMPSEPELMRFFGVGRSTIREAVRILAHSGILRVIQGLGTFVEVQEGISEPLRQRFKRSKPGDLNEVRQLLEVKIAEKAAQHRTLKDIRKMSGLLKKRWKIAQSRDKQACIEADIAFHISIAESCKNEVLSDLYKTLAIQIKESFQQVYTGTDSFIKTHPWHEGLLQSIIEQDPKKAWDYAQKITHRKE